jgi:SSS family solute:Na+ symporter
MAADGVTPASYDAIIPAMLASVNNGMGALGDWLIGLVLILVLAASMSTLSSLVITSASTITLDLVDVLRGKQKQTQGKETRDLLLMRLLIALSIAVAALIAIVVAYNKDLANRLYISDLMGISWGALAGCFLAPFLYGLFWKKVTRPAVWASFITGLDITMTEFVLTSVAHISFTNPVLSYFFNSSINAGMLAMLVGLLVVPLVSLLTQKAVPEGVDRMFSCYRRVVEVPVSTALEE